MKIKIYPSNFIPPKTLSEKPLAAVANEVKKTLDTLIPSAEQAQFFAGEIPLLSKNVPMGSFAVQKYDGTEFTRYLRTSGCFPCSKLTVYDPQSKTGLLLHLDSNIRMRNSYDLLTEKMQEAGANPDNLVIKHIQGVYPIDSQVDGSVEGFLKHLNLDDSRMIENDYSASKLRKDGLILDLSNGDTYDFDAHKDMAKIPARRAFLRENNSKAYSKSMKEDFKFTNHMLNGSYQKSQNLKTFSEYK